MRHLTQDPRYVDGRPVFSPDGRWVLFERSRVGELSSGLWIVSTLGGRATPLFTIKHLSATRADWSRATGQIVFTGQTKAEGFQTYFLDPVTGAYRVRRLKANGEALSNIEYPSWYPDGQSVCVTNYDDYTLLRVPVDGYETDFTRLTDNSHVLTGMSSVGPDFGTGSIVSFAGQRPGKPYDELTNQIWLLPPTQDARQIDGKQGRTPWWSPNGRWLALETNRFSKQSQVYRAVIQSPAGGPAHPITPPDVSIQHPKWSPEGRRLTFAYQFGRQNWGIATVLLG